MPVDVEPPSSPIAHERARIQARLEKATNACGCTAGAGALLIATAAAVIWWIIERDGRFIAWPEAAFALAGIVASAVVGKLAGLGLARLWTILALRELRRLEANAVLQLRGF